jgi:hypothetical protein
VAPWGVAMWSQGRLSLATAARLTWILWAARGEFVVLEPVVRWPVRPPE